jgi:hypothetical protein
VTFSLVFVPLTRAVRAVAGVFSSHSPQFYFKPAPPRLTIATPYNIAQ